MCEKFEKVVDNGNNIQAKLATRIALCNSVAGPVYDAFTRHSRAKK